MTLALDPVDFEANELGAAQPARDQKSQDGAVALAFKRGGVGRIQKLVRLLSTCIQLSRRLLTCGRWLDLDQGLQGDSDAYT